MEIFVAGQSNTLKIQWGLTSGGNSTINLPIPYNNVNYGILASYNNHETIENGAIVLYNKNTNNFTIKVWDDDCPVFWTALGY